ncbi:MAG: polyamine aminopropyltransferase [Sandaracinaceae bacterium]|nr:polyamine aminopropyltransferase [Sandaracinaceae bacterium]
MLTVLVISTAGLVYELLGGALASQRLGDSITQFSTTIGVYLFSMGIGAWLSGYVTARVAETFVHVELATAIVGGFEAPILWLAAGHASSYRAVLYALLGLIGTLVGLEIPLVMRIVKDELKFETLVSRVLTFDYIGALVGSLAFALVLVPWLGMLRTSLFFGLLNIAVALLSTFILADLIRRGTLIRLRVASVVIAMALVVVFIYARRIEVLGEEETYGAQIAYAEQSPYQRIVLTASKGGVQLLLNGNLQFNSIDEYRYHEALVHPAMALAAEHKHILILGGGDGLALREVFRYRDVEDVTLVDLDHGVTDMAKRVSLLRRLNHDSMLDPRVTIVNDDAMVWLADARGRTFDVVIVDFPDPNNFSLGKLYTTRFYRILREVMRDDTALVVQSTSPLFARRSFWCIERTMAEAGFATRAYHTLVPSFGEWGYVLARRVPFDVPTRLDVQRLRFLNDAILPTLFVFGADTGPVEVETNHMNSQALVRYYDAEWSEYE